MSDRIKVQQKSVSDSGVGTDSGTEISRVGIVTVAAFGVAVGLWSLACIIGGMAASGGPLAFAGDWLKAVTGM